MRRPTKRPKQTAKADPTDLGRMLVNIYESGYLDSNQAYKMSFIKGVLAGFGGVIGATIVIALVIWVLSLFSEVPLIGRFVESIEQTVNSQQ